MVALEDTLLKVENLKKYFPINKSVLGKTTSWVKAVDDVSFEIKRGETFGLVGESGCGKSTTGRSILRLIEPTSGKVFLGDKEISILEPEELRKTRKDMQIIFQDPFASLNPRHTVGKILEEPLIVQGIQNKKQRVESVKEILRVVGLDNYHAKRYPHQFSGGQRQRVGIARALILRPKIIIGDEPVSALDVSTQAQVLNLLQSLQEEFKLTYLFIAHDLGVVKHISDRVGVMYLGKMVELTTSSNLYKKPLHPYTKALLSAVPVLDTNARKERIILQGDIPDASDPPKGCSFHTRCRYCMDLCRVEQPKFIEKESGHFVACHLYGLD